MSTQLKEGQEVMRPELTELTKTGASGEAVGGDRMLVDGENDEISGCDSG